MCKMIEKCNDNNITFNSSFLLRTLKCEQITEHIENSVCVFHAACVSCSRRFSCHIKVVACYFHVISQRALTQTLLEN